MAASEMALMRAVAPVPSGMFTASTPWAARDRARVAEGRRLDSRLDGPNVLGRGAAAAAHQPRPRLNEPCGVARHVFRRAKINGSALDRAGHAGVRLRGEFL